MSRLGALLALLALVAGCAPARSPPPGAALARPAAVSPLAGRWRIIAGDVRDNQWYGHLSDVTGLALDDVGNLYATGSRDGNIQVLAPDGRLLARWAGLGSGLGQLDGPSGLAVDEEGHHVYVADSGNSRLQQLTLSSPAS